MAATKRNNSLSHSCWNYILSIFIYYSDWICVYSRGDLLTLVFCYIFPVFMADKSSRVVGSNWCISFGSIISSLFFFLHGFKSFSKFSVSSALIITEMRNTRNIIIIILYEEFDENTRYWFYTYFSMVLINEEWYL